MRVDPPARRHYEEEFKRDALRLIERGDRTIKQVALDLGVPYFTLHNWYKKDGMPKRSKRSASSSAPVDETTEQRLARLERENAALRKENESLKTDREVLKKAAAFFAKEHE